MKCPRISTPDHPISCYEKECACWDKTMGQCKELSELEVLICILPKLGAIAGELNKLNDRLGSLGQTLSMRGG